MKTKSNSEKTNLHPRNLHRFGYDFPVLIDTCPELKPFVFVNQYDSQTIDFSDADAVKKLNKALLKKVLRHRTLGHSKSIFMSTDSKSR